MTGTSSSDELSQVRLKLTPLIQGGDSIEVGLRGVKFFEVSLNASDKKSTKPGRPAKRVKAAKGLADPVAFSPSDLWGDLSDEVIHVRASA